MRELLQVLLIRDEKNAQEIGQPLWAAFKEIELFYNFDTRRASYIRSFLTPNVPTLVDRILYRPFRALSSSVEIESPPNTEQAAAVSAPSFWQEAQGKYSRTMNQEVLGAKVRAILGHQAESKPLIIVTDQEITPPEEWRYIIWDSISNGSVISLAPTDPNYWRDTTEPRKRAAVIKHRVRTAGLSVVGSMLGLERCENENCFMYRNVDSVTNLDEMLFLGQEHEIKELAGRGFAARPEDPAKLQEIELLQRASGRSEKA